MSDPTPENNLPTTTEWRKVDPVELNKIVAYTIREGPYQSLQTIPGFHEMAVDLGLPAEDRERYSDQIDTNTRQGLEDLQTLISILLEHSTQRGDPTKEPELPIDNKYTNSPIINLEAWRERKKLQDYQKDQV